MYRKTILAKLKISQGVRLLVLRLLGEVSKEAFNFGLLFAADGKVKEGSGRGRRADKTLGICHF